MSKSNGILAMDPSKYREIDGVVFDLDSYAKHCAPPEQDPPAPEEPTPAAPIPAPEGILVHEVRPGVIATDMTSSVKEKYDALLKQGAFPIRRWGTPEDVADAVSLFCSGRILYTTGSYLDVDGGFHIRRL